MPRVKHEAETAGFAPVVLPLSLLLPLRSLHGVSAEASKKTTSGSSFQNKSRRWGAERCLARVALLGTLSAASGLVLQPSSAPLT